MAGRLRERWQMLASLRGMPGVTVDLMWGEVAGKDPFYAGITKAYYAATRKRHPKFPLIRVDQYGVALVQLPKKFDEYFMMLEGSARRNPRSTSSRSRHSSAR